MVVYISLCLLTVVIAVLFRDLKNDPKQKKQYLIICGVLMIAVLGLRSKGVGSTDSNNYYKMMERAIEAGSWKAFFNPEGVEEGFQMFVWGLSRIFKDPQWLLVFSSAIIVVSYLFFAYDNSDDLPLSILMFQTLGLLVFEMQAMRQALAMSICLWAYKFAKGQKLIPFLLTIALASLMHRTAVAFVVVYVFGKLKLKPAHIVLFLLGAVGFVLFSNYFIGVANVLFEESYDTAVDSGGFIALSIYFLIIFFAAVLDKSLKENKDQVMAFYLLLFGCTCYIIRYVGALAAERISFYYMFGQTLVLPNVVAKVVPRQRTILKLGIYALCILLFAYRLRTSDLLPYEFCF